MTRQIQSFALSGGLNTADEQIKLKPGELIDCMNIEMAVTGGYRRTDGYERFDGRTPTPSSMTYSVLTFAAGGPREFVVGDIVTGVASGKTAVICGPSVITSGDWASGSALGTVGIALATGSFTANEALSVGGIYAAVYQSVAGESLDDTLRNDWIRGAANAARTLIQQVPGSGPVRGVVPFKGKVYAVRDNVAATAGQLFVSSATGWTAINPSSVISFNTGVSLISEGDTVNGQTSGATAVVKRVCLASGSWGTNAAGSLALASITGTFASGENIRKATTVCAASTSLVTTPTLPAGGTYEFVLYNFYASYDTRRVYGVNAVGKAFEFDENAFTFINSGMPTDVAEHIAVHKNYLWLSFKGSVQNSGVGSPHAWTARLGSNEIGMGEQITALLSIRQDVLGISTTNSLSLLYGSSGTDWSLKPMSNKIGCYSRCMADMPGYTVVYDTNGVQSIAGAQSYGDFTAGMASRKIGQILNDTTATPLAIVANRFNGQLRLYFNDGTWCFATYGQGNAVAGMAPAIAGWTKGQYAHSFACVFAGEDGAGAETTFAGGADGYVYQLNSGNSFDGEKIPAMIRTAFHHYATPQRKKRFRKIALEMTSHNVLEIRVATEFDYGGDWQYLAELATYENAVNGLWDKARWELFVWDGGIMNTPNAWIDGVGKTLSMILYHEDDVVDTWTVQAAHVHFTPIGIER